MNSGLYENSGFSSFLTWRDTSEVLEMFRASLGVKISGPRDGILGLRLGPEELVTMVDGDRLLLRGDGTHEIFRRNPWRTCAHMESELLSSRHIDPKLLGGPWLTVCQQCAHEMIAAVYRDMQRIRDSKASGKSRSAQAFGHLTTLLNWLDVEPLEPKIASDGDRATERP